MTMTRTCKRCRGEEFVMTAESGMVITWRDSAGKRDTWFCPACDWGDGQGSDKQR